MSGFYADPCVFSFSAPSLSSAPDNHPAPDSLEQLPFTNLLDLVGRTNYPLEYRKRAASAAKALRQKALERVGGHARYISWMDTMITQRVSESQAFAEMWKEND